MSPYFVTALEVVSSLRGTDTRGTILNHWLRHRAELRTLGFQRGFQWLDGSFVEEKEPNDLDVVTFIRRPSAAADLAGFSTLIKSNARLFMRPSVKDGFMLDAFFVDLGGAPETIVNVSRYYLGLFSHRRGDHLWKGMLQVGFEDPSDDEAALIALASPARPRSGANH